MTDITVLKIRLAEAEDAYHRLQLGAKLVSATKDGRSFQYTAANVPALKAYIAELKTSIASLEGAARRSPLFFRLQ